MGGFGWIPYAVGTAAGLAGGIWGGKSERKAQKGASNSRKTAKRGINDARSRLEAQREPIERQSQELFDTTRGNYENILRNPIAPDAQERMRRGGYYEEFAKTGGYSDADIANIKASNSAITPSFFSSLSGMLDRQNTLSGGQNPGITSQQIALARTGAREGQRANLEADIGLANAQREGRMWGIGGMSESEGKLQGLMSEKQLAALNGLRQLREEGRQLSPQDQALLQLLEMEQRNDLQWTQTQAGMPQDDFWARFGRYSAPIFASASGGGGGMGGGGTSGGGGGGIFAGGDYMGE